LDACGFHSDFLFSVLNGMWNAGQRRRQHRPAATMAGKLDPKSMEEET
jgi:hypothetical protein